MKLEVGMYVRTLDGISKVIEVKEEVEHNIMSRFANECLHETTMLTGDNIESIVTKEQFEEIKYRVGE